MIRATTADEAGNLTLEHEPYIGDVLAMAQAAHNSGGIVIAQVERLRSGGTTASRAVKVPGILVDAVIVDPDNPRHISSSMIRPTAARSGFHRGSPPPRASIRGHRCSARLPRAVSGVRRQSRLRRGDRHRRYRVAGRCR